MAALINKRTTDSRYVSVFADSTPDVDITFMIPFLARPSDHYLVGVDNLTISLSALGILETDSNPAKNVIMQVLRRRRDGTDPVTDQPPAEFVDTNLHNSGVFSQDKLGYHILSMNEFILQLDSYGAAISEYIEYNMETRFQAEQAQFYIWRYPAKAALNNDKVTRHLGFYLTPDGRLAICASKVFWSLFFIHIPVRKYQKILGLDEFVSITPINGYKLGSPNSSVPVARKPIITVLQTGNWTMNDFETDVDSILISQGWYDLLNANDEDLESQILGKFNILISQNCLLSSLDRRVSIELGASLPIKNSPMIDHNQETPDFVLGRWMFPRNIDTEITCGESLKGVSPQVRISQRDHNGVITLQSSTDRVLYHALRPQDKIQTVRLKLYARVRNYNETTDKWGMHTVAVPTNDTDWWHTRLHFASKD